MGGFNLINDGSKFTTPSKQLELLDLLLEDETIDEKFTVYTIFYWENICPDKFHQLIGKSYKPYSMYRDRNFLYFTINNQEFKVKYREGFKYTWSEYKKIFDKF